LTGFSKHLVLTGTLQGLQRLYLIKTLAVNSWSTYVPWVLQDKCGGSSSPTGGSEELKIMLQVSG